MVVANNVQTRSNGVDDRGQPLVTTGGGALPLPMPTQPETLTATRVATKANSTFFIGVPLFFHAHARHTFVLRCTVSRLLNPMVHRLRRQWGTSKGTVSLGTQLLLPRGRRRCDLRGNRRYRLWRIIFMHGGCHPVSSRLHEPFPKFWGVFCHSCQAHAFARVVYAILIGHLHSRT